MKYGNLWTSTIGAGVLVASMMTAGRTALQSPAFLFLAGQVKIAVGNTDDGIRLMKAAANQRNTETNKVHAAEKPADNEACTKKNTGNATTLRPAAVTPAKTEAAKSAPPIAVMAKLEMPDMPFAPAANVSGRIAIDPVAFHYLSESQRAQIIRTQVNFERIQREKAHEFRRATHAMVMRNVPPVPGFDPADVSKMQQELPVPPDQTAQ
jgi:hypothetical protein